ncbi:flagellar protein MotY [Legionella quinlivanii]|uniref:Flagellar protein MotY n=1 Tax=Legionella quinlivanii TaxID=45073 RepID=A0A364LJ62_9GAMM|nr:OmpA family protein [Legionella quinlivanii]RAP36567.1 flagellar protein MotY [Legionella quinlivanii]
MTPARLFLPLILSVLNLTYAVSYAAPLHVEYVSPLGTENWKMTGSRLRCGLSLTIPNFGVAYFEQYAAKPPHFIMTKWEQVEKRLPAAFYAGPPMWKPNGPIFFISKTSINPGKYGVFLNREPALKALTYLSRGFITKFQYHSEEGFAVSVILSPVKFQEPFAKYQKCLGNLLDYTYQSVAVTIILFNTDNSELSDAAKSQLDKIVEYFRADAQVKKIAIAGYADSTGRKSYNNAVSEDRAEAVSRYLSGKGIDKSEMTVTWYGATRPAETNDTEEGQAANRRVVVKLVK